MIYTNRVKEWIEKLRNKNVNHDNCGNNTKQKWFTFTCVGKEKIFITKLFEHTNLKIALKATIPLNATCKQ